MSSYDSYCFHLCVNHGFSPTLIEAFWGVFACCPQAVRSAIPISSCPCQLKESAKRAKEQGHNLKPNASCGLLQVYRITPSILFKVQMIWACSNMFQLQNSEFMECSTSKSSKRSFNRWVLRQRDPSWIHSIHQSTNTSTVNTLQSARDMAFCWFLNTMWY